MLAAIASCWALLLGMSLLMLGNGLQGSLLGLRAAIEGFQTATIGVVMTGYFVGFLVGSRVVPTMVGRVGHVRVFAALASLASVAVLLHLVLFDPVSWGLVRLVTGFAYAGLYIVSESWLNDKSTKQTRGQLLSVYMVIQFASLGLGQLLLNLADPGGFGLFVLISVLVSVALLPILLTVSPAPCFDAPTSIGLAGLYRISPLGVVGCLGTGAAQGAFFAMGAVFAREAGLSLQEISVFMAAALLGGVALQWPIGRLSDAFDRRRVITAVTLLAALAAFAAVAVMPVWPAGLFVAVLAFGGLSLPLYSLSLAHANDRLEPRQMVAASGSLVAVTGVGACFGPFTAAMAMSLAGPSGFFWWLGAVHAAIGVFALWRMARAPAVPIADQGAYVAVPPRASPIAAVLTAKKVRDQIDRDLAKMLRPRRVGSAQPSRKVAKSATAARSVRN